MPHHLFYEIVVLLGDILCTQSNERKADARRNTSVDGTPLLSHPSHSLDVPLLVDGRTRSASATANGSATHSASHTIEPTVPPEMSA